MRIVVDYAGAAMCAGRNKKGRIAAAFLSGTKRYHAASN
jgi:hypothetical protein